jgi:molybdate transport system substrate-binding protein
VSAAASLTNAFQDIARAFEKAHPGSKVVLNFAASGPLLQQIRQGAPVDVFASADQETMDKAAAAQLLAPGRVDFAANTLVVVQPAAAGSSPKAWPIWPPRLARLATGSPASVPVGRYTLEAVKAAGLEAELQPRWIYADSVRQVLAYVARGEVDAGFVYRTDA